MDCFKFAHTSTLYISVKRAIDYKSHAPPPPCPKHSALFQTWLPFSRAPRQTPIRSQLKLGGSNDSWIHAIYRQYEAPIDGDISLASTYRRAQIICISPELYCTEITLNTL
jgi:hypothetical protein